MSSDASARQQLSLDGVWQFTHAAQGDAAFGPARQITVPGIWQAQFADLRNSTGVGRYARQVDVPADWAGRRLVLVLLGVFHLARVRIDGRQVAEHRNAWTRLEVDITEALAGKSSFALEVEAGVPNDRHYQDGEWLGQLLHGKQDWYGLQGGIWKSVRLEARAPQHVATLGVRAETDLASHRVVVEGALSQHKAETLSITVTREGKPIARGEVATDANGRFSGSVPVESVALWSPEAPTLYEVTVALAGGDAQTRTIGFRLLEGRQGKLYLNGAPFYMFGALDQDWYPEQECRHPSPEFLEQRLRNTKALGLNTLRCHVKIPDELYFELCDRLGILVWLDIPYTEFLTAGTRAQVSETFEASAAAHGHHPSIAIWTIMNEGWGIDLDDNPDDRAWLKSEFDRLKAFVPTSLVVDNSPCFPRNYHVKTDIEDFHWYNGWPAQNADFQRHADEFAARPKWTFSPHGDAVRSGHEPLICSEFGVWGLPHPKDILEKDGSEPWWFESGHDWNSGCAYPHGMDIRFRDARLAAIFDNLDGFVDAAQATQYRALKFQIETLRLKSSVSGYIITELSDCQWEANGLMDARNNPRAFGADLARLHQPFLAIGRTASTAVRSGAVFSLDVEIAGAGPLPAGAALEWRFGVEAGRLAAGPGRLELRAPAIDRITVLPVTLTLLDAGGTVLNTNQVEICVVPALADGPILFGLDASAREMLVAIGYPRIAASAETAEVLLAGRLTSAVREQVLAGRKVVVIANADAALVDPDRDLPRLDGSNFPKMSLVQRDGTFWDGRWMGAFAWRRTDGPWAGLPNGPMLDEHWSGLLPRYVLTGFRTTAFDGLVDAAMAVAWLHKLAAFSKRSFLGKGWLTVTTFDLLGEAGRANPLAPHVLRALALS